MADDAKAGYIGQSMNFITRIGAHIYYEIFLKIMLLLTGHESRLNESTSREIIESSLIFAFHPKFKKVHYMIEENRKGPKA